MQIATVTETDPTLDIVNCPASKLGHTKYASKLTGKSELSGQMTLFHIKAFGFEFTWIKSKKKKEVHGCAASLFVWDGVCYCRQCLL